MVNGNAIKRTTLTAKTEEIVKFDDCSQNTSFKVEGGTVYFKVDETVTGIDDLGANYIGDGQAFNIHKQSGPMELHLYSEASAKVQWVRE